MARPSMCNYECSPLPFCQKPKISVLLVSLLLRLGWGGRGFPCRRGNRRCSICRRREVISVNKDILPCRAISWSVSHLSSLGWASPPGQGWGRSPLSCPSFGLFPRTFLSPSSSWAPPCSDTSPSSPGLCKLGQTCWCWRSGCGKPVGAMGNLGGCRAQRRRRGPAWYLMDEGRAPKTAISIPTLLPAPDLGEQFLTQFGPFSPSPLLSLALWWVATCPTCLSNNPWQVESCRSLGGTGRRIQSLGLPSLLHKAV